MSTLSIAEMGVLGWRCMLEYLDITASYTDINEGIFSWMYTYFARPYGRQTNSVLLMHLGSHSSALLSGPGQR